MARANQAANLTASDGGRVANAPVNAEVSGNAVLEPTNITDTEKENFIVKVEYYDGDTLLQTDDTPPFVLDTTKLKDGSYTISERTYFDDGSESEITRTIEVENVSQKTATDGNGGSSALWLLLPLVVLGLGVAAFFIIRSRANGSSDEMYVQPVTYSPPDYSSGTPDWQRGIAPPSTGDVINPTEKRDA
ncbi:hypothetical protein JNM87_06020 [Candidatus Saccharibacteria bacterium]|nr:hypothetical protein [Candidatus Saccharibacteria bacterium]